MAAEPAHLALINAIGAALYADGTEIWRDRIYLHHAQPLSEKPYVVMLLMSAMETGRIKGEDSECLVNVKIVAQDLEQAGAGAARIVTLLRDKGTQDTTSNPLNGGAEWQISYSRKLSDISYVEQVSNTEPVYHEGAQYKFLLERK